MPDADSLLSAVALDFRTVRVLFGNGGSPALSADLTALGSGGIHTITAIGNFPAVTPALVLREAYGLTGSQMEGLTLTSDVDLTPGASYRYKLVGQTGIANDNIHNVITFAGFALSPPANRDFDLMNYIPEIDIREDVTGELANFIACLKEPIGFLLHDVDHWIDILDCDLAPENFVDLMLRDLSNPFDFIDDLTLIEKRRLVQTLVNIYKLKGTALGCQVAIQFFMGMKSEFIALDGLGSKLNDRTAPAPDQYHAAYSNAALDPFVPPHVPFKLGSKKRWRFLIKVGTTIRSQTDAGQTSPAPAAGGPLTAKQRDQINKILKIMKPAYMIRVSTGVEKETGTEPTARNSIYKTGATVTLICANIPDVTTYQFWRGDFPGVNEFNAGSAIAAALAASNYHYVAGVAPIGTEYWNGVGTNTTHNTTGLLGNEVTNALTVPALVATAGVRKITLTWGAIVGATSYRLYRSASAKFNPSATDNASNPIEISGDLTSYEDLQESGTTKFYIITPVVQDAEGFLSNEVSATAL